MLYEFREEHMNSSAIAQKLQDTNKELFFYTPKYTVTVTGIHQHYLEWHYTTCAADMAQDLPADGLLLVVAPPPQEFMTLTVGPLKELARLFVGKKAVILIKCPYVSLSNLSTCPTSLTLPSTQDQYNDLVRALQNLGIPAERYVYCNFQKFRKSLIQYSNSVVPTDLQGGNFIGPSREFPWYKGTTLVEALDKVLRRSVEVVSEFDGAL